MGCIKHIVDMYDVCVCTYVHVYMTSIVLTQKDTLLQRSTKVQCATCAAFAQELLHRSSYASRVQKSLHVHIAVRKEVHKQRILRGDVER